ncbi:MAG: NrfD/PsrC family molybdoenzyme membrane anchor subunit [Dehalococcoidia bacterium]|nr:NrfD/PsrC family molybdoenzyme membrane anchor subunit [Dehalococcoidia bacterium]
MQVPQGIWRGKIAAYLFLAGTGAGAYLAATLATVLGYGETAKVAIVIAAPMVIISTFFLIADLGKPSRFLKAFVSPQHSWISRGTWILTGFIILGLAHIGFGIWPWPVPGAQSLTLLQIIASVFAMGTAIYTGILIGVLVGRPFWNNAMLPFLFLTSAVSTGIGATFLAGAVWFSMTGTAESAQVHSLVTSLGRADILLIALEGLLLYFYLSVVYGRSKESVNLLISGPLAGLFWGGFALVGLLLPLILDWVGAYAVTGSAGLMVDALSGIALLIGGFFLRLLILSAGLRTPIFVRVPVVVRPGT